VEYTALEKEGEDKLISSAELKEAVRRLRERLQVPKEVGMRDIRRR
jgi:hypothetical protein